LAKIFALYLKARDCWRTVITPIRQTTLNPREYYFDGINRVRRARLGGYLH
jgi:hypothetical protein